MVDLNGIDEALPKGGNGLMDRFKSLFALAMLMSSLTLGGVLSQSSSSSDEEMATYAEYMPSLFHLAADTTAGSANVTEWVETAEPEPAGTVVETGEASYYGYDFAGQLTANGERFDPQKMTAAHPSLPMDTRLRVTNLNNDRSVEVRVNDRGPFSGNRVLDLSRQAAEQIGMVQSGHAPVQIEVIE